MGSVKNLTFLSLESKKEKKEEIDTKKNYIRINDDLNHLKLGKSYKLTSARDSEKNIVRSNLPQVEMVRLWYSHHVHSWISPREVLPQCEPY